jgi:beta-phosphoglucomutase-like phosphatase (HAD superfamily)
VIGVPPSSDRRARGYATLHVDPDNTALLDAIVASAGEGDVAVFDLDGCVFDTRPRQVHIFRELGAQRGWEELHRVEVDHFRDWSTANALLNAGIDPAWVEAHAEIVRQFWAERFFTSKYVLYDHAMPGAPALVRAVHARGVHVVYLTGRDVRMKRGTEEALRRFGFPYEDRATLLVKPDFHMDDTTFKDGALETVSRLGHVALYLDNEPANVNMYRARHPHALVVFVETDHSPRPTTPDVEIPWLRSFCRGSGA